MTFFNHWTTSQIKGCQEFNDIELLRLWQRALYKGYFNESNWIKDGVKTLKYAEPNYSSPFGQIPMMVATNKIAVILVNIGKNSSFSFPDIRLRAFDPDTGGLITSTEYTDKSLTPIQGSFQGNGNYKYLSWAYSVLVFDSSETYTNDDGFLTKQRCLLELSSRDGAKWENFNNSFTENYYVKFIEMGTGFKTEILPTFNEPLPDGFLTAFVEMIIGVLKTYGDETKLRHSNYLIPAPVERVTLNNSEFLKSLILRNDVNSSLTSNNYYSTFKILTAKANTDMQTNVGYVRGNEGWNNQMQYKQNANVSYNYWKEFNMIGDSLARQRETTYSMTRKPVFLDIRDEEMIFDVANGTIPETYSEKIDYSVMKNLACPSTLPGYTETLLTNLYEHYKTPVSPLKPAMNNVFLSIIKATLQLPFWANGINNEVIDLTDISKGDSIFEIYNNFDFNMFLNTSAAGDEDISDSSAGLYVKFFF